MNENQEIEGYCTLDEKDDVTHRYIYKCNKSPYATIKVKVCGVGNQNEAKVLAEQAMEELTSPPPDNTINVGCKD